MKNLNTTLHLAQESDNSILLRGAHGIGKSERVESYAKEYGLYCEVLFLSNQETGDLIGIPKEKDDIMYWTVPIWLKNMYDAAERGQRCVLFLDELNRARLDVRQASLQLVLSKKIHQHHLPKGTLVVAAVNPEDDYQVSELDPALNDRFAVYELKANIDEWIEWANKNDVDESVISFLADNPDRLWFKTENELNHPTPRGWVKISNFLKVLSKQDLSKSEMQSVSQSFFSAKIGRSTGSQFFQFWKNRSDFNSKTVDEILKKVKDRSKQNIISNIEPLKKAIENVEVIKLSIISEDLCKKYLTKEISKLSPNDAFAKAYPLMAFLYSLPLEVLHSTLKGLKDSDEVKSKYYTEIARIDSLEAGSLRGKELFRKVIDKMN